MKIDPKYIKDIILIPIESFPGYSAGSDGIIYSFRVGCSETPKPLKTHQTKTSKYLRVTLRREGKSYNQSVSRLVCEVFHGVCPEGYEVSHQDGNKYNNRPENLKWETKTDNLKRKIIHGTDDNGVRNSRALFNLNQIEDIRFLISIGTKLRDIAIIFQCNERTIGKIKRGERYSRS